MRVLLSKLRAWAPRRGGYPALFTAVALGVALGAPAVAGAGVADVRGSIGVGYTKLFSNISPAGSMSVAAGLRYPLSPGFSVGPAITFHLLGSRVVERGSLLASIDYTAFEAALLAHWKPQGWGPIALISAGPEVVSARGELSTTGGGAAFSDLAVQETAMGVALSATLMQSREAPVRVGLEVAGRYAFFAKGRYSISPEDWKLLSARLCFHY